MKHFLFVLASILSIHLTAQDQAFRHPDGQFFSINGAKLWIEQKGTGEPLILISGGPGGSHLGMHSFDTLADACKLIYFDAYGRGRSDQARDPKEYTLARDIEDIEGIRIALKLDKLSILGHSYGGLVAQGYALKYPEHVSKLILVSTFHSFVMWQENDDNTNREIQENYPEVWDTLMILRDQGIISSDPIHQAIYSRVPYGFLYAYNPDYFRKGLDPGYPNKFNPTVYYQMVGKDGDFIVGSDIATFDFRKELKNLTMPVLILAGRYDRVAVPKLQVQYKRFCPQANFVMFERSGHNPQKEEPAKFHDIVKEFISK
ncbi:MAG: alpha/beta fold hydrolase [Bacteroidetes bacterium]|nr:alpha/beta fold hydrolase [Bacteroidota bacterium]